MTPSDSPDDVGRDRGTQRLMMARTLLAASPARFGLEPGQVRGTTEPRLVLATINTLEQSCREHLKALVDWVEDYEREQ